MSVEAHVLFHSLRTKPAPQKTDLSWVWRKSPDLNPPSTIFMMKWNADCEPHRPTLETELMNKSEPSSYFRLLRSHGSLSSLPDTVYTSAAPFFSFGWCTFKLSALCFLFLCHTPAATSLTWKLSCQLLATCCCCCSYSFLWTPPPPGGIHL